MKEMGLSRISLPTTLLFTIIMATASLTTTALTTKTIIVDKNGTQDAEQCCEDSTQCGDLSHALDCAVNTTQQRVQVVIHEGDYMLQRKSYVFQSKNGVEIMGEEMKVLITCVDAGIAFNRSENLRISGLTLTNCGVRQLSTSNFSSGALLHFKVALYFVFCRNVNIHNITMSSSVGMAVTFLNTNGEVEISNSQFQNGTEADRTTPGGGGLYIEFFVSCDEQWKYTCQSENESDFSQNAHYTISNCSFSNNHASAGSVQTTHIQRDGHFAFGRGGGLATYFRDKTINVTLIIEGSCFHNNKAEIGAGFLIFLFDKSSDNVVKLTNNSIADNSCTEQGIPPSLYSTGGGATIDLRTCYYGNNTVVVSNCNFTGNTAFWGGGLTIESEIVDINNSTCTHSRGQNSLLIEDCSFENNTARIGSAVEMVCGELNYAHGVCSVVPRFKNCNFTGNNEKYTYAATSTSTDHHKGRTFGTFHSLYLPVDFEGEVIFKGNKATGLGLQECNARINKHSTVKFIENVGKIGGGAALMGKSTIFLLDHTELLFMGNTATEKGGAIYASQSQEQFAAYSHTCFVTHIDTQNHPKLWKTNVTLSGNQANSHQGDSIYASSIFPCVYASGTDSKLEDDIKETFCSWHSWHFDGNCSQQISTAPCKFEKRTYNVSLFPGILTKMENFTVWDDFSHNVTSNTLFTTCSSNASSKNVPPLVTPGGITARGRVGTKGKFELQTADSRSVYTSLHIELIHCPPGFTHVNESACICNPRAFRGNIVCSASGSYILVGFCISYDNNIKELILTRCPFFAAELATGVTKLPQNVNNLSSICRTANRNGTLCGKCIDGHGVDIFSPTYKCIEFKKSFWKWLEAFAVTLLPLTVFFMIAVVFHVSMTSASTNGYLFFSHVMTIQIQVLVLRSGWKILLQQQRFNHVSDAEKIISKIILVPYSIWNFDFFRIFNSAVCLHESLQIMHVLALHYVTALYPILLIIIAYVIIELHARNCRVIVCLWRPLCFLCVRFRRNWELRTSVIDAFATFILLSYSKVIGVSFLLLSPSPVILQNGTKIHQTLNFDPNVEFFKHEHWPFGMCAAFILLLCACIPVLLILYPFQWFQRLLNALKLNRPGLQIFVCAFQGCFKDGTNGNPDRRYFAGIYFLMRIVVFLTYTLADDLVIMYCWLQVIYVLFLLLLLILQPYKCSYYNYLDGFFLAILAITSCSSMYMIGELYVTTKLTAAAWYPTMILLVVPSIYVIGHLTVWICIRSRWLKQSINRLRRGAAREEEYQDPFEDEYPSISSTTTSSSTRLLRSMSDTADRVENPQRYNQQRDGDRDSGLSPSWAATATIRDRNTTQQTEYGAATY